MDYVFLIAGIIVIITCFYLIVSPFFYANLEKPGTNEGNAEEVTSLETVYAAVNELEMDYLMKKLPEQDYKEMKERYQLLAANLIKSQKLPDEESGEVKEEIQSLVDEEILEELRKIRELKG